MSVPFIARIIFSRRSGHARVLERNAVLIKNTANLAFVWRMQCEHVDAFAISFLELKRSFWRRKCIGGLLPH